MSPSNESMATTTQDTSGVNSQINISFSSDDTAQNSAPSTQQSAENVVLNDSGPHNPRLEALARKQAKLEATIAALHAERSALVAKTVLPSGMPMPDNWTDEEKTKQALASANSVIKDHIALLHKYNELKDIGLGLMGLIADGRGVRVATIMEEFAVSEKD